MPIVEYTTDEGLVQYRVVPKDTNSEDYAMGILLGPPDLSDLPLKPRDIIRLSNALAQEKILTWRELKGKMPALVSIVKRISPANMRELRDQIVQIYQIEYYPEMFEGRVEIKEIEDNGDTTDEEG